MTTNDSLARFRALQEKSQPQTFTSDTTSSAIDENAQAIDSQRQQIIAYFEAVKKANEESQPSTPNVSSESTTEPSIDLNEPMVSGSSAQGSILPGKAPLTQAFGNRSSVESYSKGVNLGADFGIKKGTPLALPPGEWEVMTTFSGAKEGQRGANSGSGNLVKVVNTKTGEMLAFEHLSGVGVRPGQKISGGTVIGLSGNTGNSTGPHASIPYQDASGKYHDIMSSPYAKYLFGQGGGSTTTGMGGGMAKVGSKALEALKLLASLIPKTIPVNQQIAEINSLTPQQIQDQSLNLVTAGTVSPLESSLAREMANVPSLVKKLGPDVLPEMQQAMTKSAEAWRRVLKPNAMETTMSNSLNKYHPLVKEIPRFLKDGISKFK